MATPTRNVLFLCTGNSCRSIMAESILNHLGGGRFQAFSAGSQPAGSVNPNTLTLLDDRGHDATDLRSKAWDEFALPGAVEMDFIITTCDSAAGETCPIWPGHPSTAHWPFPDPWKFVGTQAETMAHYGEVFDSIAARIAGFLALPLDDLDETAIAGELKRLGG